MKSCLIVEDNNVVRGIIVEILAELGIETIEKSNSAEAISYCAEQKPDFVMLDWDLPSLGALDFLGGVGAFEQDRRPVIILSATENDHQQFTLAKAAGAEYHILKPFNKEILAAKLVEAGIIQASQADSGQSSEVA